jgi:hypothetical protein
VFAFVESSVNHDYQTYRRNRDQPFAEQIQYASISKPGTAGYIFGFIELLKRRERNDALFVFDKIDEIYATLQKQWSGLFQRLLSAARGQQEEAVRIDRLTNQFEELKALLLSTVGTDQRQIARAALRYRRLVVFLEGLPKSGMPMGEAVPDDASALSGPVPALSRCRWPLASTDEGLRIAPVSSFRPHLGYRMSVKIVPV